MSDSRIKSSIAFDAVCFLEKREQANIEYLNSKQIDEINYINSLLPPADEEDCTGMSCICYIISAFCEEPEHLTLDGLIRIFNAPGILADKVRQRIKEGSFTASYIYPALDMLEEGFSINYVRQLNRLKSIGFEALYNERIMPMVKAEMSLRKGETDKYNCKALFDNIALLKNNMPVESADIYISFFSYPTAFALYAGSFLTCFCPAGTVDFYSIIAHELMHGFAGSELTRLYRKYVEQNEKLSLCHKALIENYHSGDEEEFVLAAEYYLCSLSGLYKREQLLQKAKMRYGGNCPTSVAVFELLLQEESVPKDYERWLIDQFRNGRINCAEK